MGRGQEIFESWRGTRIAGALTHMRPYGDRRLDGNGPAVGGNCVDDQGTIVAQPLDCGAAGLKSISDLDPIDAEAGDAARLARGWRSDPQFDALRYGIGEGKLGAVWTPNGSAEFPIARQRDGDVLSARQPFDRERDVIGRHVQAVGTGINADAR